MIEGGGNARRGCQVTRRGWADRSPPSPPEWRNKTNETASDGKRPISLSVDRALGAFSLQRDRSALGGAAACMAPFRRDVTALRSEYRSFFPRFSRPTACTPAWRR